MKTELPAPSQLTLREILFASALTFIGMAVLNSVTFTDNPALGCAVALIATILGGGVVMKISTPNSLARLGLMPVAIFIAAVFVAFLAATGHRGLEFLAAVTLIFGIPIGMGVLVGVLLFPKSIFSDNERHTRYGLIAMTSLLFGVAGGVFATSTIFGCCRCGGGTETAAAAACKAYAEAQEIYHRTDYDRDGVLEYAQSMYGAYSLLENKDGAQDLLIIDPAFAEAAWENPNRISKAGYFFKVLHAGGCKTGSYIDDSGNQTLGFALLAVPAAYDVTGRNSFLINNTGTIYQKDLGPNMLKIAEKITDFQIEDSWVPTE